MAETDTIIFYRSFYESISEFSESEQLKLYNAVFKLAFDGIDTEFSGMSKAVFSLMKPLILAVIKNQSKGQKGGRPKNTPPTPEEENKLDSLVDEFIDDYKEVKNPKFNPTENEKRKIKTTIQSLGEYDSEYWKTVFLKAKGGFLFNGKIQNCTLKKILEEHNAIFRNEANLQPNAEIVELKKQEEQLKKQEEESRIKAEIEIVEQERTQAKNEISNVQSAVEYLNKYVPQGKTVRQISSDYRELKELYPIMLDSGGIYHEKTTVQS